jgi:hypothetical protein
MKSTGEALDVEISSSPCVYHDQPAVVVLARDISGQLRYERDLHALALIDELTGATQPPRLHPVRRSGDRASAQERPTADAGVRRSG